MKRLFTLIHNLLSESLDSQMIEGMRLVLASAALLIIYIDPAEPDRFVAFTHSTLVLYTVYSAALLWLAWRQSRFFKIIHLWTHWLDLGWYTVLIALSSGTNSLFFFGFFFAILTASFRWGYMLGIRVTVTSALIFTIVGVATAPGEPEFQLNRFLLRPTYLLVFGYMFAYWGGYEIKLRRRLTLLKDLTLLSNPRLGIEHTIGSILERLRSFYQAEACLLVLDDAASGQYRLHRATAADPAMAMRAEPLNAELAEALFALPNEVVVIYHSRGVNQGQHYEAYDLVTGQRTKEGEKVSETLTTLLDVASFISVPLRFYRQSLGRLYLSRQQRFEHADADFLLQVVKHIVPVIDNIRLVDQLASNAAEDERQRIARDLHDSIIQPYIGLQMGLAALQRNLPADDPKARIEVQKLIELTNLGVAELRHYVAALKEARESETGLLAAVQRFASKYAEVTGIAVQVEADCPIYITNRLAAEAFQMVAEGLSNVRRHTHSKRATIKLACDQSRFFLGIENDHAENGAAKYFTPVSITERAEALGGQVRVEQQADGRTLVAVEIPL